MFEHAPESKFILKFIDWDPKSSFQKRKRIYRKFILPSATVLYYLLNKNIDERKGNIVCSIRSGERFSTQDTCVENVAWLSWYRVTDWY